MNKGIHIPMSLWGCDSVATSESLALNWRSRGALPRGSERGFPEVGAPPGCLSVAKEHDYGCDDAMVRVCHRLPPLIHSAAIPTLVACVFHKYFLLRAQTMFVYDPTH
jgi:hypothetical protein